MERRGNQRRDHRVAAFGSAFASPHKSSSFWPPQEDTVQIRKLDIKPGPDSNVLCLLKRVRDAFTGSTCTTSRTRNLLKETDRSSNLLQHYGCIANVSGPFPVNPNCQIGEIDTICFVVIGSWCTQEFSGPPNWQLGTARTKIKGVPNLLVPRKLCFGHRLSKRRM